MKCSLAKICAEQTVVCTFIVQWLPTLRVVLIQNQLISYDSQNIMTGSLAATLYLRTFIFFTWKSDTYFRIWGIRTTPDRTLERHKLFIETWSEHSRALCLTKSTHCFLRFLTSGLWSVLLANRWSPIPFVGSGVFEQPQAEHLYGIILGTFVMLSWPSVCSVVGGMISMTSYLSQI